MNIFRFALGEQSLVGEFHRGAGGKHRVYEQQHLTLDAWRGNVFDFDFEFVATRFVLAIRRYKGILSLVEEAQKTLVERQSGAEHSGEHHIVG